MQRENAPLPTLLFTTVISRHSDAAAIKMKRTRSLMLSLQNGDTYWIHVNKHLQITRERKAIHGNITLGSNSKIKIRGFTEHLLQDTRNGLLSYRNRRHDSLTVAHWAYTLFWKRSHNIHLCFRMLSWNKTYYTSFKKKKMK